MTDFTDFTNTIVLKMTCGACPEQYNAYLDGRCVAYLRLRNGYFYAEVGEEMVYEAYPNGDGCFECDERDRYLGEAVEAIRAKLVEAGYKTRNYVVDEGGREW